MNLGFQRASLEARLKAEGVEPDTVDLAALLDPTLSRGESLGVVEEALGVELEVLHLPSYRDRAEEARFAWAVEEWTGLLTRPATRAPPRRLRPAEDDITRQLRYSRS